MDVRLLSILGNEKRFGGARFVDGEVVEYVSSRPDARAYLVQASPDGAVETMIEPNLLV